jgi:hypothetical protein
LKNNLQKYFIFYNISYFKAWGSYDPTAYDLGNPYLSTSKTGDITNDSEQKYYQDACCKGDKNTYDGNRGSDGCPKFI